jgi:hypothetical protein
MENKGFGRAQDWLTVQRPAIIPAEGRESALIRAAPRQVILVAGAEGRSDLSTPFSSRAGANEPTAED